ncbi:hypothetical protein [Wolbachia pipientis]|uniref:hypothetical protein n=1 Tax=Wolbachia pipientis TaxID=955 RepID=UPI00164B0FA7|nr:hypothetical protein [Wolbachia pipientis]
MSETGEKSMDESKEKICISGSEEECSSAQSVVLEEISINKVNNNTQQGQNK